MTRGDDYIVESGDEFEVITRRKGPREAPDPPAATPAAEPPAPAASEPEPQPPAAPAPKTDGGRWLGSDLPDPPAEPMRIEPPTPPRPAAKEQAARTPQQPSRTREPNYQYGGEPAGVRDLSASDPATPPSILPPETRGASRSSIPRGNTMQLAIAATEFNYDITSMMMERAHEHARFLGAEITHVVRVPGVYDLPYAVKRLLKRDDVDGVVTLGCVIEGETDHDDLVIQHAARKIIDLSLEHDKPVGLGITGPGMSRLQAMARIDRAKEAVEAAVRLHRDLEGL